ncbi:MAG TPA: hypothetical protein VLV31_07760 [Candidatus Acidoferrales bacterium]|nr:hypothetical protein [Candidatus Acidoferrales bacterium]
MKRTFAAFTIMLGLTAIMIGLYLNESNVISAALHGYVFLFP